MYSQCLLACICNQEHENGKLIIITSGHSKLTTGSIAAAHSWISDHIDYTISWYQSRIHRAYDIVATTYRTILRYHAWTHVSRVLLAYCHGCVCVWLMSLAVHTICGSLCLTFPAVHLSCSALHWEPGMEIGGWQLHQWWAKLCVQKGPLCSLYRVESKS